MQSCVSFFLRIEQRPKIFRNLTYLYIKKFFSSEENHTSFIYRKNFNAICNKNEDHLIIAIIS